MQPIPYFGEKLSGEWIYEPKIDGWRMEIIKFQGKVEFWGRRLEKKPNWTQKLKKIIPSSSFKLIPDGTILDAELYSNKGRRFIPSLFSSKPKAKPIIFVFDIIFYKGEFIGSVPLRERKKILESLSWKSPLKLIKYKKVTDIGKHLIEAIAENYEGIIIKDLNSPYIIGEDSPMATADWRKIKPK
jgi:ATP-dependent DNA ligase